MPSALGARPGDAGRRRLSGCAWCLLRSAATLTGSEIRGEELDERSMKRYDPRISTAISATWVGVRPTFTPFASSASAFAAAVPFDPDTIAPAWPIVLPGGAVKPAMYATTGF